MGRRKEKGCEKWPGGRLKKPPRHVTMANREISPGLAPEKEIEP